MDGHMNKSILLELYVQNVGMYCLNEYVSMKISVNEKINSGM